MPAPVPRFLALADLQANLRLTGIVPGSDAQLQFHAAVREGWTELWRRLGAERVAQLVALSHVEPPVTSDDHLRVLAEITETNIVRLVLYRYFAAAFKEGSSAAIQEWNTEGLFRNLSSFTVAKEIDRLETTVAEAVETLALKESPGSETSVQVGVPTSENVEANGPIPLGTSIFGSSGIFSGGGLQS